MVGPLFRLVRLLAALALSLGATHVVGDEPLVRVGILGFRPVAEEQVRWQPLIDHLNAKVRGYHFRSEVLGYNDLEAAISRRTVEFVLTNPGHYVLMTHRNGMSSPFATLMPIEQGKAISNFGGVIFAKANRTDVSHLTDLRGKTIAATSRGSLGGYQAQAMMLLKQGVRIPQDAHLIETDMPHDKVVHTVLSGRAMLEALRLPPFDVTPEFTPIDI